MDIKSWFCWYRLRCVLLTRHDFGCQYEVVDVFGTRPFLSSLVETDTTLYWRFVRSAEHWTSDSCSVFCFSAIVAQYPTFVRWLFIARSHALGGPRLLDVTNCYELERSSEQSSYSVLSLHPTSCPRSATPPRCTVYRWMASAWRMRVRSSKSIMQWTWLWTEVYMKVSHYVAMLAV